MYFSDSSELRGGFSYRLFNNNIIQNHIKECSELEVSCIFGYLGHEKRSKELDIYIEEESIKRGFSDDTLAEWVISKNGRYFGDSLIPNDVDYAMKEFNREIKKRGLVV